MIFTRESFKVVDKRGSWLGRHPSHGNLGILIYPNLKSKRYKFGDVIIRIHSLPTVRGGEPMIEFEDLETLSIEEAEAFIKALRYAIKVSSKPFIFIDPSVEIPKY